MTAVAPVTENQVEAAIVRYMQQRGWIAERNNVGLFYRKNGLPIRIGRPGQPDWRFRHPRLGHLQVEVKRPGARLDKAQLEYIATELALGFSATWTESIDAFAEWYESQYA